MSDRRPVPGHRSVGLAALRVGLRARVTAAFAVGALVLSALLAGVTYGLVRGNLVRQRESTAVAQAYLNGRFLRDGLGSEGVEESELLDSVPTFRGASPVLLHAGEWFAPDLSRGREELPVELREMVIGGSPARMRFELPDGTHLAVGIPIPAVDAAYFEISSLAEMEGTLNSLGLSLLAAALVTTLAGAGLGASLSRRVLRPLSDVANAAQAIAGGRLDTRVARVDDADLGVLVDSFNDMARALQERIERDARFASDVSHELRSPLTTLTAAIDVLEGRRDEMPPRAQAALDLLVGDVRRFSAMVEDLLEISRFDAGAARLDLSDVRISELVLHTVATAPDPDVPVAIEARAADCIVEVDKRRITRVVANLIDNAAKYGGGATAVTVELAGDNVRIAVEDEGPGVPRAERQRVFERFARGGSEAGRRGSGDGVGLGLALVREHVHLHGGDVWVEDRPDSRPGARFVIELPTVMPTFEPADEPDMGPAAVPATEVEA